MVQDSPETPVQPAARQLAGAVERLGRLPVLSATVRRVQAIANSDDAGVADMVAALEADQGLAADLLRYANSAACTRRLRAHNIRAAVALVGRKAIAQMAVEAATFRFFQRAPGNGGRSIGQLHIHAAAVAASAQAIAERTGAGTDVAHLGGLLHDVGKLVMPLAFGEPALDLVAEAHPAGTARARHERECLGVDHAVAGALVARASQVDVAIQVAIATHHGGDDGLQIGSLETACVIVADELVGLAFRPQPDGELLRLALAAVGLDDDDFDDLALEIARGHREGAVVAQRLAELERQATVDDLTGVLNRRHWLATVRRAVAAQERGSVLICDVDRFKDVNDCHGHATGDLVLAEVARQLATHGVAGRLGGDEFAVWVPGGPRRGDHAAATVLDSVAAAFAGENGGPAVGVSIGAASPARTQDSLSTVLHRADEALYEAKRGGRGRAVRH
jgi:diguanylate cyclase (GGDEF)-like protein/putative nucleotidyltransferase with HDIG domain